MAGRGRRRASGVGRVGAAALTLALLTTGCATEAFQRPAVGPDVVWGSDEQRSGTRSPAATVAAATSAGVPRTGPQLPRGGHEIFPRYRLVGYAGYPGSQALGRLGIGDLGERMTELEQAAAGYAAGREPLPVMELIAATAHNKPQPDNTYRTHVSDEVIAAWLAMARERKALLLLNIQPGRAKFLDEVKHFEKWLKEPDVGVALDPEWAVGPDQVPGRQFGTVPGSELNDCAAYVAGIVAANDLPEKVFLYHQLHPQIVTGERALKEHPGVVLIKSVDGIGSKNLKTATYNQLVKLTPAYVHLGFKLFFEEDTRKGEALMTPEQVLALSPQPEYVLYE